MIIRGFEIGPFGTDCYIVGSEETGKGMIIDPAADPDFIMKQVKKLNLDIKIIVATHSHPDHLMALGAVKKGTGAKFAMHGDEPSGKRAAGASRMISLMVGGPVETPPDPDIALKDGDIIEVGDLKFTVLHTPGHSPGGICLYGNGVVFAGDTLFNLSVGRSDFPGCSHEVLIDSIQRKLMVMPDDTIVYPGHGPKTTIGDERRHNPFLRF
ncbi:MAG: MBL fold metallo-hydrolase [Dehalococcoidia bacterium]|jgi:glyoxylase-like metal-dependent hydrolase (beta-lactamase superfamily II)